MKKVLMSVALVSAIAIAAGYSMIGSEKSDVNMSELTQANVEALAGSFCPFGCLDIKDIYCYCDEVYELRTGPDPEQID